VNQDGARPKAASSPCNDGNPSPFVWSLDRLSDVGRALLAASRRLREAGSDTPQLDSAVLMAHVLGVSKTWLYAHPSRRLAEKEISGFEALVRRRMCHEPVAYLVGYKPFYGLDITVDQRVLIPRPETELLVERVLAHARHLVTEGVGPHIADVGTGSGAIAVALAVNLPQAIIFATDASEDALAVAGQNVWRYGVGEQIQLLPGSFLDPVPGTLEIVVANLPYVASTELGTLPPQVRNYEPMLALDGGSDGLEIITAFLRSLAGPCRASGKVHSGSRVFLEVGAGQGARIRALVQELMPDASVELLVDYADLDRVVVVTI
jgi:release factor glutamine methyltransferase